MARTAAPKPGTLRTPEKKYDAQGKVSNWSVLWDEARDLEALVVGGRLDGMAPAEIRTKFPQYNIFAYKPFASGLNNIRLKHNKEVKARSEHAESNGKCEFCLQ
jgi:hypothetical protein